MANIELKWTKDELVTYISNHSAYVAQTLSLGSDVAFDVNTLTEDNESTFLDDKIEEAVNSLVPYFSRIVADDAEIINDGTDVGLVFTPRIVGGEYSQVELAYVKTISRKVIASYVLADWYSLKGIVAMNNYFTAQYAQSGVELTRALDRFVRPVRKASSAISRVTYKNRVTPNYVHINNRSDFAIVWETKDGSPVKAYEYDIDFYTDENGPIYNVNIMDGAYVKTIAERDDAVRIIFDFDREDSEYFANGVLKYHMYGNMPDTQFTKGRHIEQSGELLVEIWDGASDNNGEFVASYIPAYLKLTFDDLTEEDIAVLQGPAIEAGNNANIAANYANNQAYYAQEQGDYAKAQGDFAKEEAEGVQEVVAQATQATADAITATQATRNVATSVEQAEQLRQSAFNGKIEEVDEAVALAQQQVATSVGEINTLIRETTSTLEEVQNTLQDSQDKIDAVDAAISSANVAIGNANNATSFANEKGEFAEDSANRALQAMEGAQNATNRINDLESSISNAEQERKIAETMRYTAESVRASNEEARKEAETARENALNAKMEEVDGAVTQAQADVADAVQGAETATTNAETATNNANEAIATLEDFKEETTERVEELALLIDRVFDGGRADSVYGPSARVINCGGA